MAERGVRRAAPGPGRWRAPVQVLRSPRPLMSDPFGGGRGAGQARQPSAHRGGVGAVRLAWRGSLLGGLK